MHQLAQVELAKGAPAELTKLLLAVGVVPYGPGAAGAAAKFDGSSAPPALRVEFVHSRDSVRARREFPVTIADHRGGAAEATIVAGDLRAVACHILSRALRLPFAFITTDAATFATISTATSAARGRRGVIVEGETGTGKKSLIRLIHCASGAAGPMREIDCAAFDDVSIAGEIAAAVNASLPRPDAIFLDQIDELSASAQARLLAAFDDYGLVGPAGAVPIRLFAAASRPLDEAVKRDEFSRGLWESFDVALRLPPLRDRPADLSPLAREFLRRIDARAMFAPAALKALADYRFPGNVRELHNLVTRLAIARSRASDKAIGRDETVEQLAAVAVPGGALSLWRLARLTDRRALALDVLAASGGDSGATARSLGLTDAALLRLTKPAHPRLSPARTAG